MIKMMMVAVDDIHTRADARPLNVEFVSVLAKSIEDVGLDQAITLRPMSDGGYELIAGNHRFAACDGELGWREIPAIIVDDDDLHAELRMIDENLMRAELTVARRASVVARRKEIYEALHPQAKAHVAGANASNAAQGNASANIAPAFATSTASATGRSERAVQLDAERGQKIAPAALDAIAGTALDTGRYLDEVKRVPREDQAEKVKRDLAAPKPDRSARAPAPLYKNADTGTTKPAVDPFASWIDLTESTATLTAKAIFEACPVRSRPTLSQRCEAIRAIIDELDDLIEQPRSRGAAA